MTLPVDIHNQQVNALYDTGTGCSLINYSMLEKLGINLNKGYQPMVKSSTGENMGVLGQVTFTFKINDTPFTQSFIVCRHMTRHIILGTDFTVINFMGVIWTREGMRKLMHSNGKTIIVLLESTSGVPLVLGYSVKIGSGGHLMVPLECTRPVTDRMNIRMDIGFHHKNLNVYMSCTECKICAVVATRSTSMTLLPRCSRAPTERHSSPVEAVLSGSEAALLGLVEIPKSPDAGCRY